jgi:hypothetical protein
MDKLLKEAIADAKTVKETALANAKIALEEAFAPKLQSMLSAKINEEEDELEDEDEVEETITLETKDEEEADETEEVEEAKGDDDDSAEETEEEDEVDEDIDLNAILAELEKDSEETEDEVEEGKTDAEELDLDDVKETKSAADSDDEEIDLDELLAELGDDSGVNETKEEDEEEKVDEIKSLKSELSEYRNTVIFLKKKINEINLLNAKLLYSNKLFKNYALNEKQKVKILESLDRTNSVREVKLVYSTLAESFNSAKDTAKKKITEAIGGASKAVAGTKKPVLESGNELAERFQHLANIKKK